MAMYGRATARAIAVGSNDGLRQVFAAPLARHDSLIAVSVRPLSETERQAATRQGYDPREYRIAMDGIAIIVNERNPVESLDFTLEQVRDVFSGRIRNWRELGGRNQPIRVCFGTPGSGTYTQLRDSVLGSAGLVPTVQSYDSMIQIIRAVQQDEAAIGYCGSAYLYRDLLAKPPIREPGIRALALARTRDGPFVTPDPGTVYDRSYPLWRYIYLITRREPKAAAGGFVTFAMSSRGQQVLVREGLAPVTVKFTVNRTEGDD
jgi:phosphate transport system substrate-binding protein